jgi:hypothetical protein
VHSAARENGQDAQPVRVGERREDADELVAGQVLEINMTLVFHV